VVVIGFTVFSANRIFSRLDAVAIVERRELSTESAPAASLKSAKSLRPLSASTFYKRHRRRAVVLISAMAAAIMMVSLLIFNFTITGDAEMAGLNNWNQMSLIRSEVGPALDPGVVAQIRTHPTVGRVIPTIMLRPLSIAIPPFSDESIYTFGVSVEDMAYLVELYDLELGEGHLPRPYTNEVVISQIIAQNRDLQVGDVIGSYDHPAYEDAPVLPAEMVISGIFARPATPEDENWLSFASIEFLDSHEAYSGPNHSMLVVPRAGQKAALDEWLENQVASARIGTTTYWQEFAASQESTRSTLLTIAVIESAVAIVVAVSLAVLNYISVSQRQSEFGVLSALGWHRLRLVWRTVRETAFTTTTAWGFSVALCCIVLLGLQVGVFAPLGLRFNFFNPTPWLSTLPIPIMVLVVTAGTIGRTLSKLDPVAIIERR
jgi:ABC-type lipoprotein release transport system permease subunit